MKFTKEQIGQLKASHKNVFVIEVDDKSCALRTPTRAELGFAAESGKADPFAFNEVILRECWLGGDEDIRTDDSLFLAVCGVLDQLLEKRTATIKKL